MRNYLPEVINIQRRKAELNITLMRTKNFDIKQKSHGIFVLLHANEFKFSKHEIDNLFARKIKQESMIHIYDVMITDVTESAIISRFFTSGK